MTNAATDARAEFYITSFFDDGGAARAAQALAGSYARVERIRDVQALELDDLLAILRDERTSRDDQRVFLEALLASRVFPKGVVDRADFANQLQ